MKRTKFNKFGSYLLWNLGFAVGYGMISSFSVKSNYKHNLVRFLFTFVCMYLLKKFFLNPNKVFLVMIYLIAVCWLGWFKA